MFDLLKKYRIFMLAACLVLVALLFYSSQLRNRQESGLFYKVILQVTAPVQGLLDNGIRTVADTWNHYLWLVETERRNEQLQADNARLRAEIAHLEEVRLANERLRKLLAFRDEIKLSALPAQVVAVDASSWFRTVVIDKGSEDGLSEGLPVVVAEGVVGRTLEVAPYQSRVLLLTDASSAVAVLIQANRSRGICRGNGQGLTLEYALSREQVAPGDAVVTSGTGGIFPKGLPVGRVTEVRQERYGLFQGIDVEPAVDFSRLEEVLVLLKEKR